MAHQASGVQGSVLSRSLSPCLVLPWELPVSRPPLRSHPRLVLEGVGGRLRGHGPWGRGPGRRHKPLSRKRAHSYHFTPVVPPGLRHPDHRNILPSNPVSTRVSLPVCSCVGWTVPLTRAFFYRFSGETEVQVGGLSRPPLPYVRTASPTARVPPNEPPGPCDRGGTVEVRGRTGSEITPLSMTSVLTTLVVCSGVFEGLVVTVVPSWVTCDRLQWTPEVLTPTVSRTLDPSCVEKRCRVGYSSGSRRAMGGPGSLLSSGTRPGPVDHGGSTPVQDSHRGLDLLLLGLVYPGRTGRGRRWNPFLE